ncbi:MAG: NUDIX hydrolase [Epsilonproteobacteria bacterium]|nr:NUDIX hydrolase [Campylobacterota bacterium]OIO15261.1 MAG: NUDIX hydrolase [Helicobacteraceae bacterium CG1_02_36_14]PIP10256.1 MAG: NUDIX hydrolase [Sulfurimonas sp. CG23_combo_of_CG06-09_8_20_14_all_36_33]PIS26425.1 MAG: NUDIX hydrolase [Sulfurimonas sp. CG08_land_8_20_14_0_20_36_33]PIU33887.1 MAG: NUDIX hydrolase [Sulfurimonas sp. CG07_land_8_20_14_0_80_36_56]PIV03715.1 MAG: NUDIX hydrolase [Sulfurimonas sp. CG03_land_8_20_14_0_80_36_25]PIV34142.1 MAG: NUDIX hydrolase [Sulfurimonas sp.
MVKIDSIQALENPIYAKPIQINYTLKNIKKTWEAVLSHDSVSILLWHVQKESFILVKQLRITVLNSNKVNGYTYELCAGLVDKDAKNVQIAKEEILEECGYDVPVENIQRVTSYYTNVGISGALQTLYYAEVSDAMQVNNGGGLEEEDIEVIYLPFAEAKKFMFDETQHKTPGLIMAFYWFFDNIRAV